ncbi:MAG TPA: hypothetical protein VKV02_01665, partial [Acidobacteriaceae bacterium]|nr:hypothetical protein [Acidobacteriaceae bacterium]
MASLLLLLALFRPAAAPVAAGAPPPPPAKALRAAYGQLPLSFEANAGQTDPQVAFLAHGSGYTLFLTPQEAVLALRPPAASDSPPPEGRDASTAQRDSLPPPPDATAATTAPVLRLQLVGANPEPAVVGQQALPGTVNYLVGNDPAQWHTHVPTYAQVQYQAVYPGVDLVYHGDRQQLEYDFVVAPGADPTAIRLRFEGADRLAVDAVGDLVVQTAGGPVVQRAPVIYQEGPGGRQPVAGGYVVEEEQVRFAVGAYDASRPLVLDPVVLAYSTYLGGSGSDAGFGIAVDG